VAMIALSECGTKASVNKLFRCRGLFGASPTTSEAIYWSAVKISQSRHSLGRRLGEMRVLTSLLTRTIANVVQKAARASICKVSLSFKPR
jgi:hypothetical protein